LSSNDDEYDLLKDRKPIKNFRKIKDYTPFINERFKRCLDLYLCPRMAFKAEPTQEQLDNEMPELPNPNKLKPFPCRLRMHLHSK